MSWVALSRCPPPRPPQRGGPSQQDQQCTARAAELLDVRVSVLLQQRCDCVRNPIWMCAEDYCQG